MTIPSTREGGLSEFSNSPFDKVRANFTFLEASVKNGTLRIPPSLGHEFSGIEAQYKQIENQISKDPTLKTSYDLADDLYTKISEFMEKLPK